VPFSAQEQVRRLMAAIATARGAELERLLDDLAQNAPQLLLWLMKRPEFWELMQDKFHGLSLGEIESIRASLNAAKQHAEGALVERARVAAPKTVGQVVDAVTRAGAVGQPEVAEVDAVLKDGRTLRLQAYLDEFGQAQVAERQTPTTAGATQPWTPLLQRGGEFVYPSSRASGAPLQPLDALVESLDVHMRKPSPSDRQARHAASLQQLKSELSVDAIGAQVEAVTGSGQRASFQLELRNGEYVTHPPLDAGTERSLQQLRYTEIKDNVWAESSAKLPTFDLASPWPNSVRDIELGQTYKLAAGGIRRLTASDIEQKAVEYYNASEQAAAELPLRVNVLGVPKQLLGKGDGRGDHFQLEIVRHRGIDGLQDKVAVRYLDVDGKALPTDAKGRPLMATPGNIEGRPLNERQYGEVALSLHSVGRDGRPQASLYEHPELDRDDAGWVNPPENVSIDQVMQQAREALNAFDQDRVVDGVLDSQSRGLPAPPNPGNPFYNWPIDHRAISEIASLQRREKWWQNDADGRGGPNDIMIVTVAARNGNSGDDTVFEMRILPARKSRFLGQQTQRIEYFDLSGRPLALDRSGSPIVWSDQRGADIPLESLDPDEVVFKVRKETGSDAQRMNAAETALEPLVVERPLDVDAGQPLPPHGIDPFQDVNKAFAVPASNARDVEDMLSADFLRWGGGRGREYYANVAAVGHDGKVEHFLIRSRSTRSSQPEFEYLDLNFKPLPDGGQHLRAQTFERMTVRFTKTE
jgi:hypothetical protein